MSEKEKKRCPYCAEEILLEAIKCKHCESFFEEEEEKSNNQKKFLLAGVAVLVLASLVGLFFFFYTETHEVVFRDQDGVIETQTVEHEDSAVAPDEPEKEGYDFITWDKDFDNITEDLTIEAEFKESFVEYQTDSYQFIYPRDWVEIEEDDEVLVGKEEEAEQIFMPLGYYYFDETTTLFPRGSDKKEYIQELLSQDFEVDQDDFEEASIDGHQAYLIEVEDHYAKALVASVFIEESGKSYQFFPVAYVAENEYYDRELALEIINSLELIGFD